MWFSSRLFLTPFKWFLVLNTTDQMINYDDKISTEVVIEDKTAVEQMRLIQQLEEEDKQTIFKLIDKMLTIKKFKDFFAKNVATL